MTSREWKNRHHLVTAVVLAIGLACALVAFLVRESLPLAFGAPLWLVLVIAAVMVVGIRVLNTEFGARRQLRKPK